MPADALTNTVIVNNEALDTSTPAAPGFEPLDGNGLAIVSVTRLARAPTTTDQRQRGQLWIDAASNAFYYSTWSGSGPGAWVQVGTLLTLPSHAATHEAGGADELDWATIHGVGPLASRPTAATANAGYYYDATDTQQFFRSNGVAWVEVAATSGTQDYTHIQATPVSQWVVSHNLNRIPGAVSVVDSAGRVWFGAVVHISVNQLTISFGAAFAGTAYLR